MVSNAVVAQKIQQQHQPYWEYIPKAHRDAIPDEDFAWPEQRKYPIDTQDHLDAAATLIGHAPENMQAKIKSRAIAIAKRKGFTLPKSWQDEEKPKEASMPATISVQPAGAPLATIKVCWLEDDAISLNGRQYPKEAVGRLILSAQVRIADPNGFPITCYLNHDSADKDRTLELVGRVIRVWREGTKAYAAIAIPDTHAGRDMVKLIEGGFIKSMSLRADGGEIRTSRDHTFPVVGGADLQLCGIDFTTMPGLAEIARIEGFLTEAHSTQQIETFHAHYPSTFTLEEASMPTPLREDTIPPMASGTTVGVDGSPGGDYSYPVPPVQNLTDEPAPTGNAAVHQVVHDHLAGVLDAAIAPIHTKESARRKTMTEAGRKIAMEHMRKLAAAHDEAAHAMGKDCEGGYEAHLNRMAKPDSSAGNDGMQDGDDDDTKESKKMTPEEAARLLQEAGYTVAPPKTPEQILEEKLAAMQAAFDQKLAEAVQRMQPPAQPVQQTPPPPRTSLVEGATQKEAPKRPYYRPGDYLREQMRTMDRTELLDRSRPLPEWLNPERALKEMSLELMGLYDKRFGLEG